MLSTTLSKEPTAEDIATVIASAEDAHHSLRQITDADRDSDTSPAMSIGYGIDSTDISQILSDFQAVQGVE